MNTKRDALGDLPEPKPLYDPLLAGRRFLLGLLVVSLAVGLWRLVPDGDVVYWIALGVGLVVQLAFLYALPSRPVDALYLRAFVGDDASFDARLLVEATLHPEFRLSGIRPPRRRMPLILRPFLFGLFAMRYLGIRYMSLEAESDWLARLWKSLSVVRVVIIDLRQVTPHLNAEIDLSLRCVGLERMLFVCDADSVSDRRKISDGAQWAIGIALVLYLQLLDPETSSRAFVGAMNSPFPYDSHNPPGCVRHSPQSSMRATNRR